MKTAHVAKDILPFEPNYPSLNPRPTRNLTISGTQSSNLAIQLIAYYSTLRPLGNEPGYESCYRTGFIGPINMLHLSEPLKIDHDGSSYKASVIVDKYEPGKCAWRLRFVLYKIANGVDAKNFAGDSTWYGTPIVFVKYGDPRRSDRGITAIPRNRVDIWCAKQSWAEDLRYAEACGALAGLSRVDYSSLIPPDQRADRVQIDVFPDNQAAEVNFHDLDTLIHRVKVP
jgi:hypothetical protein